MVRIPPQWECDEEVAADVMWSVCVVSGKTSFTREDDAVQALKKMNEGQEQKGFCNEDNANDKVTEEKEKRRRQMPRPGVGVTTPMGRALPSRVGLATLHMAKA